MNQDIIKILADWNPWWEKNEVPPALVGVMRDKSRELIELSQLKEVKIVVGVRRCGKSTLLFHVVDHLIKAGIDGKNILMINLEDAGLAHYSLDEIYDAYLSELNPRYTTYIFLDEVQRKNGWERWIRKRYDLKHAITFFVSGSSASLLKKEYSSLLTGRNLQIEVFPLSFKEFLKFQGIEAANLNVITDETRSLILFNLKKYLEFGGFPEVFFKEEYHKRRLLNQYFEDIIYKDIVERYKTDPVKTKEIGVYLLTNMGNFLSLRNIRNVTGLGIQTLSEYLSYMAEVYLIYQVPIYSHSLKEQSVNLKKIYCIDTGLRNAVSFKISDDSGRLFENCVFIELKRRGKDVYYWKEGGEVDFLIKDGLKIKEAIQACWQIDDEKTKKREVRSLLNAMDTFKLKSGLIITGNFEGAEKIGGMDIIYMPLWKWLLQAE